LLYYPERDLSQIVDAARVFYGEGRGEFGTCLHVPLKGHMAGSAPSEDHMVMISFANHLLNFLKYQRAVKGPEDWDYDPEKAAELYTVCGDNPNSSGVTIMDRNYNSGPKVQIFLDKTFGSNEVSIRWKNHLVGDERLLDDYESHIKTTMSNGHSE
jgi:hypothetical protein